MNAAVRALCWKEFRQLRSDFLSVPATLVVVTGLVGISSVSEAWGESLVVALGPLLAAAAGGAGTGDEREDSGLAWLRARAIAPRHVLLVRLWWRAALLAVYAATVAVIVLNWPGLPRDGWSRLFDAPNELCGWLAVIVWLTAFCWTAGLSWVSESQVTVLLGGTLLTWMQTALLITPAALLGGRPEDVLSQLPWLVPGFLGPPLLVGAWAFRRWNPLHVPWPRARLAGMGVAVLALALAGSWVSLRTAREAEWLHGGLAVGDGIEVVESQPHPTSEDLVAREVLFTDGRTRVLLDDGEALRTVLPLGTTIVRWLSEREASLVVRWPQGELRVVHPDGSTRALPPGLRDLEEKSREDEQ